MSVNANASCERKEVASVLHRLFKKC